MNPDQSGRFAGAVAIVTGASRGIGFATAKQLVAEGARVVVTGRKVADLDAAVQELGGRSVALASAGHGDDVRHITDTVALAVDAFGRLDVLVTNVGINPFFGPLLQVQGSAASKTFQVNVLGALEWVRAAEPALRDAGGAVVSISSVAGIRPAAGIGLYGASKAALAHLTQQLALELAPAIRVNAVLPAVVRTRFAGALFADNEAEVAATYPMGRIGEPDDIASAVAFLASRQASWITGQLLVVDGGLTLRGGV